MASDEVRTLPFYIAPFYCLPEFCIDDVDAYQARLTLFFENVGLASLIRRMWCDVVDGRIEDIYITAQLDGLLVLSPPSGQVQFIQGDSWTHAQVAELPRGPFYLFGGKTNQCAHEEGGQLWEIVSCFRHATLAAMLAGIRQGTINAEGRPRLLAAPWTVIEPDQLAHLHLHVEEKQLGVTWSLRAGDQTVFYSPLIRLADDPARRELSKEEKFRLLVVAAIKKHSDGGKLPVRSKLLEQRGYVTRKEANAIMDELFKAAGIYDRVRNGGAPKL